MDEYRENPGHTRREFVKRAVGLSSVALFGGGLLAACGGSDEAVTTEATTEGPATQTSTSNGTLGPATLNFVGWEGYDALDPKTFPNTVAWTKEQKLEINSAYISTTDEMFTKIQASSPGTYDLTSPSHLLLPTMIAADVLEPIDTGSMQYFDAILPVFRDQDFLRDSAGTLFAVPFTFSQQSPLYNADKVKPLESFGELVENPDLKGRYTISDDSRNFTWIAQVLGLGNPDPNHLTPEELKQCQTYAREVIEKARTVSPSLGDILQLMITGEVDYSTNGTYDQVAEAQQQGVNIQTFFAKEGAQTFVDVYAIPKGSEKQDIALGWIDHMLTPEAQVELAAIYGGGAVNLDAVPAMPPEQQERYDYTNLDAVLAKAPIFPPTPAESDEFATLTEWTNAWNEVK